MKYSVRCFTLVGRYFNLEVDSTTREAAIEVARHMVAEDHPAIGKAYDDGEYVTSNDEDIQVIDDPEEVEEVDEPIESMVFNPLVYGSESGGSSTPSEGKKSSTSQSEPADLANAPEFGVNGWCPVKGCNTKLVVTPEQDHASCPRCGHAESTVEVPNHEE